MLKLSHCSIGGKENDDSGCTCDNESSTFLFFEQPERINKEKITIVRIFVIFVWGGKGLCWKMMQNYIFYFKCARESFVLFFWCSVFLRYSAFSCRMTYDKHKSFGCVGGGMEYISNDSSNFSKGRELMRSVFASRGSVWDTKEERRVLLEM